MANILDFFSDTEHGTLPMGECFFSRRYSRLLFGFNRTGKGFLRRILNSFLIDIMGAG